MKIIAQLDALELQCREYLIAAGHSLYKEDVNDGSLARICTDICAFMRNQGFDDAGRECHHIYYYPIYSSRAPIENFHHLFNHFPHRFLSTHRKTIPLSLVYIFVAIARRLGIEASPTDFPHRVMAHVSSPNPAISDIYVDVYGSSTKAILSTRDDVPRLLLQAGIHPDAILQYISPSTSSPMLLRAARNILSSLRMLPLEANGTNDVSEADCQAAMYASYCVNMLLTGDVQVVHHLVHNLSNFPLDLGPVLHDTFAALLQPTNRRIVMDNCNDAIGTDEKAAKVVNRRSETTEPIKYFIGMVFEHAEQGYLGCIKGWEVQCISCTDWSYIEICHRIANLYGHRRLDYGNGR
jgi:F-box protein 21